MRSAAAALLAACATARADDQAAQVFSRVAPNVYSVLADRGAGEVMQGSAVVVAPGRLVTNYHVVAESAHIVIQHHGQQFAATLEASAPDRDLALLRADVLTAPPVSFGSGNAVQVGQSVYAIGSPRGLELSLSEGIISSVRQLQDGAVLQTTAPISPGSSGGGLFDASGRLIGITTAQVVNGQNLNFAIPVEALEKIGVAAIASPPRAPAVPDATPAVAAVPAVVVAAPAAPSKPQQQPAASDSKSSLYWSGALIVAILLLFKPAVNWLTETAANRSGPPQRGSGTRVAPAADRLAPFREQARAELTGGTRDATAWIKALEDSGGDQNRAIVAYVEARARTLQRAEMDRRWQAQAGSALPGKRPQ